MSLRTRACDLSWYLLTRFYPGGPPVQRRRSDGGSVQPREGKECGTMPDERERFNEYPPDSEDQLSPPVVSRPLHECAESVYVHGFTPGATVRVYVDQTHQVGERTTHFGGAEIGLSRPLERGDDVTATQTVNGVTSVHSLWPVTVSELPVEGIRSDPPTVGENIYECGHIVPVSELTPSVEVEVADNSATIGRDSTGNGGWESVWTSQLHANQPVRAREVACADDPDRRVEGPWSAPESVRPAPSPIPEPVVAEKSLVVGNDVVVVGNCLPGAEVTIEDAGTTISSGWYATSGRTRFPVDPPLQSGADVTAVQELCGNRSPPSEPATPTTDLQAPEVLEPLCDGARYVVVRDTVVNAVVVVFRNGDVVGYGGAGNGEVLLALGGGQSLSQGDDVTARQYLGPTLSPQSNTVTVGPSLAGQPHVDAYGDERFFEAETSMGEEQIDGPVFTRGGAAARFTVRSCCDGDVEVTVEGPAEETVAELSPTEIAPGYHSAVWHWESREGWDDPSDVPVGEYRVHASTDCDQDDVRRPFYVIFDPADVNGPRRFSFNETGVWFGTRSNSAHGILYQLHPDDRRIFSMALSAASGETSSVRAAEQVALAEQRLFNYDLSYHTTDTIDLLEHHEAAQCADDAAFLTAMLRAVGIPAHPTTADAAFETGDGDWSFDTWVEFRAPGDGDPRWLVLHPHEDMSTPTTRRDFGTTVGVAVEGFNDLVVMADVDWKKSEASDSSSDLSYDRNRCGQPVPNPTKKSWVRELCEGTDDYWKVNHWNCDGTSVSGLRAPDGFRFDWEHLDLSDLPTFDFDYLGAFDYRRFTGFEYESERRPRFGGTVSGTIPIRNDGEETVEGMVTVELCSHRLESKRFAEETFDTNAQRMRMEPMTEHDFGFELAMPETLPPGRDLYVRARLDESTLALHEVQPSAAVESRVETRTELSAGDSFSITGHVHNVGDDALGDVRVSLSVPSFVGLSEEPSRRIDRLAAGTEQTVTWQAEALAPMEAGTVTLGVHTPTAGSSQSTSSMRIVGPEPLPGDSAVPRRGPDR
jgi:hypothetical protein